MTPYNTGKVRIGCAHTPTNRYSMSDFDVRLQTALLPRKPSLTIRVIDGICFAISGALMLALLLLV